MPHCNYSCTKQNPFMPRAPRPPVSETKAWGSTDAQQHSKTSPARCSLPRDRMATDSYTILSPSAQVLACSSIYMHTDFFFILKNKKKLNIFVGTSNFYHSSPLSLAKLHESLYTALLFAAKWGWKTTLLCPDLSLFWGLNWRCHKPVPGCYRITQNFYLSARSHVCFFLLYFKF